MSSPAKGPLLRSVSDTALLVAYHRAMESERPDALFKDAAAIRLSAGRGEAIAHKLTYGKRMAWSTITRTVLFDDVVTRMVAAGADTVVNLAAGLDARPYRLALPPKLRWVEVDLPEMVRDKTEAMAGEMPACRVERIACDLADATARRALLARLADESGNILVMSEGLLVYLPPATVGELADDLHAQPAIRRWAFDLATPMILKRMKKWWGKDFAKADAMPKFAPEEGTKFFEPHGWREAEFHAFFENSIRLHREMKGIWMFKLMMKLSPERAKQRMALWRAGVAVVERQ